jgi:hypothetical protein
MKKKIILFIFSIFLSILFINLIDASLCRGYDGYYHDCYYLHTRYIDDYKNYFIFNKIIYQPYLENHQRTYVIKDERDYQINFINTEKRFNIYLERPVIVRGYKIKSAESCPEGFFCIKRNLIR